MQQKEATARLPEREIVRLPTWYHFPSKL